MTETIYSLIPPVLALLLVIVTRRVFLSLGIAILVGALMAFDFQPFKALAGIFQTIAGFIFSFEAVDAPRFGGVVSAIAESGFALNDWELLIMLFLLFLGMLASLVTFSGGSKAFADWAAKRMQTRKSSLFLPVILGIVIFIDDYFNSLTVGNISRPVTDRFRVSRAKLAYIVDSTAAPVCVIMPLSSWGAFIIGTMASILATYGITDYSGFQAFLYTIPMNLYAIVALSLVVLVIVFNLDVGLMRTHEERAQSTGALTDPKKGRPAGDVGETETLKGGRIGHLFYPILALVISTVSLLFYTGAVGARGDGVTVSLLSMLEYTDIGLSLVMGGIIGFVVALLSILFAKPTTSKLNAALLAGLKSMMPAIGILLLAWTTIEMIDRLGTGAYLASLVDGSVDVRLLPAMIFVVAGVTAVATGTSWGTFGILLPIAGEMANTLDVTMIIPMFAAVLAGSIFGDHISPISDTTILSSAGSGSDHMDHVMTQLPYAILAAVISFFAFIGLGYGNVWTGLATAFVLLLVAILILLGINKQAKKSVPF
ncbi:Na+/H+ antiporter NhaC family protein [Shouchella shacheensis]|uniref:Na+/H+ antiporter NhaC family protein n=1 Tax=Shouchella shacheensis TaxID=1649580 RepID=UPI0007400248|nr:Na+/H+ antiporter NhaC family protein [Shouchella shacheensis]